MKQLYALILLVTGISVSTLNAQNVFNQNDKDSIFTGTPPPPPYGIMVKWGHKKVLNWGGTGTTTYKSYYFSGLQFRLKYAHTYQQNVNDGKLYPLYVFFQGEGEAGNIYNNEQQLYWGGQTFRDAVDNGTFDGFLFYDQTSNGYEGPVFSQITGIIDSLVKYCKVDPARVIVNGLSSGGQGVWDFVGAHPQYVCTALPISAARPEYDATIPNYIHVPLWLFNGGKDNNPAPAEATALVDSIRAHGGYIQQTFYPTLGHGVWNNSWSDPGFFPWINSKYQSDPLVYFQKTNFCPGQPISARLGLTSGFFAYQWMFNGTVIPGATSNEITVTQLGTYSARFQRKSSSGWSDWSHNPAILTSGAVSSTPNIQINGLRSDVIPAPDSSKFVPLIEPTGYVSYKWVRVSDSAVVSVGDSLNAPAGTYVAQVTAQNACSATYSAPFKVINANGPNGPDPANGLAVSALSQTSLQLVWSQNPHPTNPETGFEVYRGTKSGGPYILIAITPKDTVNYLDHGLIPNTNYYYVVRAINANAGSASSNEGTAVTLVDNIPPTAPTALAVTGTGTYFISLQWTAATDNVGVAYYDIYVEGKKAYTTAGTNTSFTVDNLVQNATYYFQVKARDAAGNISPFSNQVSAAAVFSGLTYQYFQGAWTQLPNFNTLTPKSTGLTNNISLSPAKVTTNFGFLWTGFINIRKAGTYTFETDSDDGSDLWIGSLGGTTAYNPTGTPLVNNDGLHGVQARSGSIALSVGQYPIAIAYFQAGGGFSMQAFWTCAVAGISRSLIPDSAFKPTFTGAAPAAPTSLTATPLAFNKVSLSWAYTSNGNNSTGFQVFRSASAGPYISVGTTGPSTLTFIDSTASPSTGYNYKVQTLGLSGQSAFSNLAPVTTPAAPPAPKAPFGVKATVLSSSSINVAWKDTSNDAVSFQIYRAAGSNAGYRLISTINNAGGTNFNITDAGLFDNVLYYYEVDATGPGGTGAFSNYDSGVTLLNNPVITPIANFTMRFATQDTVPITVANKDGVPITISSPNLPAFAVLTDNGNGTGRIIFSPATTDQGSYNGIILVANASNGGVGRDTFNLVVNSNYPPVLNTIPSASFNEGSKDTVLLSATDQDGLTDLVFSSSNLPSFANLVNNNNGTASMILNPTYISHGVYAIAITVTDAQGGTSNGTLNLTIVKKNPNKQYLVRMQYQYAVGAPWNNMTGPVLNNLAGSDGTASSVSVSLAPASWWNTYNQGPSTGNNSGVYPDSVMREYYYFGIFGGPNTVTDTISGLNPNTKYNLKFYGGSSWTGVPNNGTTIYTIGSQNDSLSVQNNTKNTANFNNVLSDATGRIVVAMNKANDGTPVGYLNAFEIDYVYDDSTAPAKPTNLTATLLSGTGVQLSWTDIAYNAQAYNVYRATDTTQPFTLLNPGASNPNATSFVDSTVSGHTTYYYKLKAVNNYGDLGFTNTVSITTAAKNPTITGLANTTAKINTIVNIPFTATDDPGDAVTVTDSLPSFVTLQNLGSGSYNLSVAPTSSNIGAYTGSVTATDAFGAVTKSQFQIFVVESNVSTVYLHFGTDTSVAPQPWNNFLGYPFANRSLSNLQRADGSNSGMTVTLLDQWSNPPVDFGMVTGDNSGIFPDVVLRSSLFETSNSTRRVQISGLDTSKTYNVVVFSSVNSGQTSGGQFAIGAQSVNFNPDYNSSKTLQFNGLKTATGAITLTYTKNPTATFGYFNALLIQSYDPSIVPLVSPNFVYAEPLFNSKTSLNLYWADRSSNETGFEIWRSTSLNGTFSLVQTVAANATTYTDQGLTPNTQYFYQVRAVNAGAQSDFSSLFSGITPASIVLEHFTASMPEGIKPWNNTGVAPQVGDRYANLYDDQLNNTGLAISVLASFGGEFNGGMNSGHNSYVFPDTVMQSMFWVQNGSQIAVLKLDGLDQTKKYRIGFEGSSTWNLDQTAFITMNSVTKYLNADSNTTKVVYFNGVTPDVNGQVFITFGAKGIYGLLGSMVIMSYTDNGIMGVPTNGLDSVGNRAKNGAQTAEPAPAAVADELQNFRAYPNPFRDGFSISYDNMSAGKKIVIEVYTMEGKLIYAQEGGYSTTGTNTHNVYLPQTTPLGMYVAKLKADGKPAKVFKLIKIR